MSGWIAVHTLFDCQSTNTSNELTAIQSDLAAVAHSIQVKLTSVLRSREGAVAEGGMGSLNHLHTAVLELHTRERDFAVIMMAENLQICSPAVDMSYHKWRNL
jgi:glycerate kinase